MQRVSALLPAWERSKIQTTTTTTATPTAATAPSDGRPRALTKVWGWADKLAGTRRLSTTNTVGPKVGREVYWPTTLDRECEKAARILKSFCSRPPRLSLCCVWLLGVAVVQRGSALH